MALCACSRDPITVGRVTDEDYNRQELSAAVDRFVAAGRTADAFAALAAEAAALRPGMDQVVAKEAERRLLVLALGPVEVLATRPMNEQVSALATTVWPFALGPPLDDQPPTPDMAARVAEVQVRAAEAPESYLVRLCGWVLAADCKHAVPEQHGSIVRAVAVNRMTQRVRNAVQACLTCAAEPAWRKAVHRWEDLDREAAAQARQAERRAHPERWPTAGLGAGPWPNAPLLTVEEDGDWILGGDAVPARARISVLERTRHGAVLGVHVPPSVRVDMLAVLLGEAAAAGYREVAVQAREGVYPWRLRAYRFAVDRTGDRGTVRRVSWRPSDTVQVLLRAVDADGLIEAVRL